MFSGDDIKSRVKISSVNGEILRRSLDESRDGDELELAFEKLIENEAEAVDGLPVKFMTEDDRAGLRIL